MKPNKKPDAPGEAKRDRTVDDQNGDQKTNEQEEDGGAYARPREADVPGQERPNRGS